MANGLGEKSFQNLTTVFETDPLLWLVPHAFKKKCETDEELLI